MSLVAYDDSESDEEPPVIDKNVKTKQTVKISIPTVSYDSDDEPASKKTKIVVNCKKSGLLSILPPPKVLPEKVLTLVPNVLKKKPVNVPLKEGVAKLNSKETKPVNSKDKIEMESDESEDDDFGSSFDEDLWRKIVAPSKRFTAYSSSSERKSRNSVSSEGYEEFVPEIQIAPEAEKPYEGLDNAAFKELVGKSKQKIEDVNIIDIHEDEIRPDKMDWLKSLTDPNYAPKKEEDSVNDTCKRKHHITYLAQQAKANELELQNQWSQNRFARKQTQAKYGF